MLHQMAITFHAFHCMQTLALSSMAFPWWEVLPWVLLVQAKLFQQSIHTLKKFPSTESTSPTPSILGLTGALWCVCWRGFCKEETCYFNE
jgi:hypothetical protein